MTGEPEAGDGGGIIVTPGESATNAYGIVSAYIFGLEYNTDAAVPIVAVPISSYGSLTGIETAVILGGIYENEEIRFAYYMRTLREMQNIYDVDIYALLDQSADRRATMDDFLTEMDGIIKESENVITEIQTVLDILEPQFNSIVIDRDEYEVQFFENINALNGELAYNQLQHFIVLSKQGDEVKAYFNAYRITNQMLINSLNFLQPRYRDILANKEAIIKGIRVFDIPGSDIEAIIRLEP